jgi:hypothetical protein
MDFLREIDIFGEKFSFSIFGKDTYNTHLGGLLTIAIVTLTIVFIIMFGLDLILRTNPNVVNERVVPENYTYFNCNIDNFPIFWRFSDNNSILVNHTDIFYPKLTFYAF